MVKALVQMPIFHPLPLFAANKGVFGLNLGHLWHETDKIRTWMQALLDGLAEGWVRPYVDKSFPLDRACEAHTYIESRKNIGKVVLTS